MSDSNTEVVAGLVVTLKDRIGLTKITANTIHVILKEAMELVEELNIPGSEKKDNVIEVVKCLVNDLVDNVEEKKLIMDIIDNNVLENTMDLIIKATKGEININNKKTQIQLVTCFSITLRAIATLITKCKPKKKEKSEVRITLGNNI